MDEDREVDELLQSAGERWRLANQRPAPVIDRRRLHEAGSSLDLAALLRAGTAAALVIVVAAVALFALIVRPPDHSAVSQASPSPISTATTYANTPEPTEPPTGTPTPTLPPMTHPPAASPTARPIGTPPSLEAQRATARQVLEDWSAFVAGSPADMVLVTEGLTTLDHGWRGRNADNAKTAFLSGVIESEVKLPQDSPPAGQIAWPDGSTMRVELLSAVDAFDAIRDEGGGECGGCTPVHVVAVRLTAHEFDTTRGPTQLPVWEFTLREGKVHVFRVAAAHARVLHSNGRSELMSVSTAPGTNELTVKYLGGRCRNHDLDRAHAVESDVAVVVFIRSDEQPTSGPCVAVGVVYTITVALDEPLGSRTVLDINGTPTSRDASWLQPR